MDAPVSGKLVQPAFLHLQLNNCGANIPVVTGSEAIIQDSFDLGLPTPGGPISGTISTILSRG